MMGKEEFDFANNIKAAHQERAPNMTWVLLFTIGLILTTGFIWAQRAVLEEVTTGSGRVIPSSQMQVVQTLEGGIIGRILVKEGDTVEKGQIIMQIDDTGFASRLGEVEQRGWARQAEIARLEAESSNAETLTIDADLIKNAPEAVLSEQLSFRARGKKLRDEISVLKQQFIQRSQELQELYARSDKLKASQKPLLRELELTKKLFDEGVVPEVEWLRLQRQAIDLKGDINVVIASIPRLQSGITEAENRIETAKATFRAQALERLAVARSELAVVVESLKAAQDRVVRTALKAPVRGIVNKLNITTIGAVVQPGNDIVEIVPLDDTLLIEAQIRPQDVAFIRQGQEASVKLSAYDYSIYGALKGKVERISADTLTDARDETFYRVIIRTEQTNLVKGGKKLPIIPGMVATVDILTGTKTVLDYILKPVKRVRDEAFRER
jgi:membrane fusion protein, adhesin transport system